MLDREPCGAHQLDPLIDRKAHRVARVPASFPIVEEGGHVRFIGHDIVDKAEHAALAQDACHLVNERGRIGEVVRSDPTGDEIERGVVEGKVARVGHLRGHVLEPGLLGSSAGKLDHLGRQVGCRHACHRRGEGHGDMAGRRGDVQRIPVRLRVDHFYEPAERCTLRMHFAGCVVGGVGTELSSVPVEQFVAHVSGRSVGPERSSG